jgi:hypothetical protein
MPFCLLLSGKALKNRTNAVGDLNRPSTLTIMLKRDVLFYMYSDWWVTLLCEVIMVTHNDAKCISYAFPSPPQRHQALKDHTNAVGDL